MQIRAGYQIAYECAQPTPMLLMLSVHPSRQRYLLSEHRILLNDGIAWRDYVDGFGNICTRLVAPPGLLEVRAEFRIRDSGLPDETLRYLMGSRYCDTQKLSDLAWSLFAGIDGGWQRVQAICDYVHEHIEFGYHHARCDRTASEGHAEQVGVCRDFAHLAVTLCRCMNIPARYCTGYLGDMGTPPPYSPMDFAAWFEAYLGDGWYTFDARNNVPRIGRVLIARGRDAADVALTTSFGPSTLESFKVWTDEIAAS